MSTQEILDVWKQFEHQPKWIQAIEVVILAFLFYAVLVLIIKLLKKQLKRLESLDTRWNTGAAVGAVLNSTRRYFLFSSSVMLALECFSEWRSPAPVIKKLYLVLVTLQILRWASTLIDYWVSLILKKRGNHDASSATTLGLISFIARVVVFTIIILAALNNLGVNITALITDLGVGGVAVALAVQNILGDLFASLSIILDRAFVVGDAINVDGLIGTIEHVGLKTTRVRALSGEQLIFSNSDLLKSRIRNYKRMSERRVVTNLTVTYETSDENLRRIPKTVQKIIENQNTSTTVAQVRFDRCHFLEFMDSSLRFECVYWVLSPDYNVYADLSQEINFQILKEFKQLGIEFAYPTQTVYQTNLNSKD